LDGWHAFRAYWIGFDEPDPELVDGVDGQAVVGGRAAGSSRVVEDCTFLRVARVGPALEFLEGVGRPMGRQCLRSVLDHRGCLLVVVGGRLFALLLCGSRLGLQQGRRPRSCPARGWRVRPGRRGCWALGRPSVARRRPSPAPRKDRIDLRQLLCPASHRPIVHLVVGGFVCRAPPKVCSLQTAAGGVLLRNS